MNSRRHRRTVVKFVFRRVTMVVVVVSAGEEVNGECESCRLASRETSQGRSRGKEISMVIRDV